MVKMKKYLLLIIIVLFITSCKKDSPIFPEGFGPGQPNIVTYQPISKNSSWIYTNTEGKDISTTTQTITGNTAFFSGVKFFEALNKYSNDPETDKVYYSQSNHVYTMRSDGFIDDYTSEMVYLIDSAKVNDTWSSPIIDDDLDEEVGKIVGTLKEKDSKKLVNGVWYKNVIHTQVKTQYLDMDDFEDIAVYDFYVAKGIGIIQMDIKMDLLGINASSKLTSYTIK